METIQKCTKCGKPMESGAAFCAACGAPYLGRSTKPKPKDAPLKRWQVIGIMALIIASLALIIGSDEKIGTPQQPSAAAYVPPPPPTPTPFRHNVDQSPEMQAKRKALIDSMSPYFKVKDINKYSAEMWISEPFKALKFDDKKLFAAVVFAYSVNINEEYYTVVMMDDVTGKKVGTFSAQLGLRMD